MKRVLFLCVAAVAAVCVSSEANAVLVTRNTALDVNVGVGLNATINTVSVVGTNILVDVNVLKAHVPFSLGFNIDYDTAGTDPQNTNYTVTVNMQNLVSPGNTGLGFAMNGYDYSITDGAGGPTQGFLGPFTSTVFAPGGNLGGGVRRFGGILGGGGQINAGGVSNETFRLFTSANSSDPSSTFALNFTANPEPATLLLGSLAMIPAGVALRRRRKAQQDVVEAV
jgi:hypothetical protein